MRGFDIFMRSAKLIYERCPDVLFVVVGSDRICYGGDEQHHQAQDVPRARPGAGRYDLSKFVFTGWSLYRRWCDILSLSDLHIYLTVPFVLSWSLMDALACGCTVLASDTAPVREMIATARTACWSTSSTSTPWPLSRWRSCAILLPTVRSVSVEPR